MLSVVADERARAALRGDLDELAREGARRMLAAALEAEVDDYLAAHAAERDEAGRRLVVRNGHAREREVTTAAGAIPVRAPRVDDRRTDPATGGRARFRSVILPPWCRKSPKVAEVLPLLYLRGLSTGDFVPALEAFFGSSAGLSAAAVGRLLVAWQADYQTFCRRDLADRDYVYVWADGMHFRVRLEQARLCCLVIVAVRADGTKELVAVADGERESTDSWAEVLRDLRRRGMQAPVVAVGDGALGLWAALRDVFPATRHQRDWVHKAANVLGCLPTSVQAGARRALAEIRDAPDRDHAVRAIEVFARDYGTKWPKAVAKITDDAEELLTFFDFPAEHWLPEDQQPDRVDLLGGAAADPGDQGPGQQGRRVGDGVQAAGVGPGPLAGGQRPPPGRAGPRRRAVRQGGDDRASRRGSGGRRVITQDRRSTTLDDSSAWFGAGH
jgi:putative transposase